MDTLGHIERITAITVMIFLIIAVNRWADESRRVQEEVRMIQRTIFATGDKDRLIGTIDGRQYWLRTK